MTFFSDRFPGLKEKILRRAWDRVNAKFKQQESKCEETVFSLINNTVIKPLKETIKSIKYSEDAYQELHSELEAKIVAPSFTGNQAPQFFGSCTCCGNLIAVKTVRPVPFVQIPTQAPGNADFDNPQNNENSVFSTGEIGISFKDGEIVTIELLFRTTSNCGCG